MAVQPLQTSDLTRMGGHPFGTDDAGRPIGDTSGMLIIGPIQFMQDVMAQRAVHTAPASATAAEREKLTTDARDIAFSRLIEMLNTAIGDKRYYVSQEYLLNSSNKY